MSHIIQLFPILYTCLCSSNVESTNQHFKYHFILIIGGELEHISTRYHFNLMNAIDFWILIKLNRITIKLQIILEHDTTSHRSNNDNNEDLL